MNILHITTHLDKGGIVSYVSSLAIAFQKRGHTVAVASCGGHNEALLTQQGIGVVSIPIRTKSQISPRLLFSYFRLKKYLKENPVDIIHAHTRVTQVLAAFLSKKNSIPFVTTCHGFFKPRWHRKLFPCWGDGVIAISSPVQQHLIADFGVDEKNISLIHSGVDIERLKAVASEEKAALKKEIGIGQYRYIVGSAGRFSTVKGLEYLIRAIPHVIKEEQSIRFLFVGYGKDESRLREIARRLSLENIVFFYRPKRDIACYLDAMDIFVAPSLQEGLGLSILEAQAKQIPVIASDVGGIPDIIDHRVTGLLVKPKDPSALAAAIVRLLREAQLREYLRQNAFHRVSQEFSLGQMVDKTEQLYQTLVEKGHHAL